MIFPDDFNIGELEAVGDGVVWRIKARGFPGEWRQLPPRGGGAGHCPEGESLS